MSFARRVRVYDAGVANGQILAIAGECPPSPVLDINGATALNSLRVSLAIRDEPGGHCMCHGDLGLEFLDEAGAVIATIGEHHGHAIRWDRWQDDALLANGKSLLTWLAERGFARPLKQYEEDMERQMESERAWNRWQKATPECLRSLEETYCDFPHPGNLEAVTRALAAAHPIESEQTRLLLEWYGSGQGPWSGFPSYESVPEKLLMQFPLQSILDALDPSVHPSPAVLEGAARFLAG